ISTVMGSTVHVASDESFGKVADIVVNDNGCVDYVVLNYRNKFYFVPWKMTRFDFSERVVTINVRKSRLLKAPSFTRNRWPKPGDTRFTVRVRTFFESRSNRMDYGSERDRRAAEPGTRRRTNEIL